MGKQVTVAKVPSGISLLSSGLYGVGNTITLSDNEYNSLPDWYLNGGYLTSISNVADPTPPVDPLSATFVTPGKRKITGPGGTAGANAGASQTLGDPTSTSAGYDLWAAILNANLTLTFPTATAGAQFTLRLTQDASGGRTVTFPGGVSYPAGSPSLQTAANAVNEFVCTCWDGTTWEVVPVTDATQNLTLLETVNVQSLSANYTLPDVTTATMHRLTLTATPLTLTLPAAVAGKSLAVLLVQDATGSRVPTLAGAGSDTIAWFGGSAPTFTTTANKADEVSLRCYTTGIWRASAVLNG